MRGRKGTGPFKKDLQDRSRKRKRNEDDCMAQSRTKDMTQGPILPLIVKFSLPLLMGNLFQQTYNLVDTAIVGQTLGG